MAGCWEGWLTVPASMTNVKMDIAVCRMKGSKNSTEQ